MVTTMSTERTLQTSPGVAMPLGAYYREDTAYFSIVIHDAVQVILCLYGPADSAPTYEFALDPCRNRSGSIWHIAVHGAPKPLSYVYRIDKQPPIRSDAGVVPHAHVVDPYAREVTTPIAWHTETATLPLAQETYQPRARLTPEVAFDWQGDRSPRIPKEELLIYEMHVRGFTRHASSRVDHPGTFLGLIDKIDHLKSLGVNAVEFLPVWEFNEAEYNCCALSAGRHLCQYWGYSPVSFFSLMNRFAADPSPGAVLHEWKTMVRALHRAGIQVILDVVFNHTAEGGFLGPTYSFKGIDPDIYYLMDRHGGYLDYTGCGNTLNANHPQVQSLVLDSLRYWVSEMHVDGFRFDLASTFSRGRDGQPLSQAPIVEAITADPLLSDCLLIAEPWDARGLYQVGSFYLAGDTWSEWNGQYRDTIRRFIKGSGDAGMFATRICGSQDLYGANGSPLNSINFVTAHDGFTLRDLVSYNRKHNYDNGENNQDGLNENESWNCGWEGATRNPAILRLRERQMRNHHVALMVSRGIPMILMGDEYGHTKHGNNNTWCQDNDANWFQWDRLASQEGFLRFFRLVNRLRKQQSILRRPHFMKPEEIVWHGLQPNQPDWHPGSTFVAFQLLGAPQGSDLYVAFNAGSQAVTVTVPPAGQGKSWHWVLDTGKAPPQDIYESPYGPALDQGQVCLIDHSSIVLIAI